MNYSNLTDAEVNKMVAKYIGLGMDNGYGFTDSEGNLVCYDVIMDLDGESRAVEVRVNYCKNPSDALPIIVENKISVFPTGLKNNIWQAESYFTDCQRDENPLRAAMIVYLMMQEQK